MKSLRYSPDNEGIRDNMIFASRSPCVFNVSIRDNLRIVKSDLTDEKMMNACLDEDIWKTENGYDRG